MSTWPPDAPDVLGPTQLADVELLDEDFLLSFLSPLSDSEAPLGSTADSTDSDDAESSGTNSSSSPASPSLNNTNSKSNRKEASRLAMNRARLDRYYKSQDELSGLRSKVEELQTLLAKLKKEDEHLPAASLEHEPCPFIDSVQGEIGGSGVDPSFTVGETTFSWKCVAMREHRRRQRAVAVRRKLRRLLRDFEQDGEDYMRKLPIQAVDVRSKSAPCHLPAIPVLPGAETPEAFTLCGVAILRELHRMACCACGIEVTANQSPSSPGGELAYSFLLGADIETRWSREFEFPVGDPQTISSLWLRGVWNQAPSNANFRISIKRPAVERSFFERKFAWRPDPKMIAAPNDSKLNLDGVTLMQIFEATDHVVLVWTVSFYASEDKTYKAPFFRASGWLAFKRQGEGVTCQSSARVHSALRPMVDGIEDPTLRRRVVNAWAETMQTKQHRMWTRLLLVT